MKQKLRWLRRIKQKIRLVVGDYSRFGFSGLRAAFIAQFTDKSVLIEVERDGIKFPFYIRAGTSDAPTYDQIFLDEEYDFVSLREPAVIVDAGANIGLSSIYFANKFPHAIIIAIEPELSNYKLLLKNVKAYNNVRPMHAALWNTDEDLAVLDQNLGKWAFKTAKEGDARFSEDKLSQKVRGMTIQKIIAEHRLERIDILKMDIEGAEKEIFQDSAPWIGKVNAIIVELHERMRAGCNRSFYNGSNGFENEWAQGERVYLSRGAFIERSSD